eukprot:7894143-Alexandrium_andersonii.AAC.1
MCIRDSSPGVQVSGQEAQALGPDLNDCEDMILLQGPPEARAPMERRLLHDPVVRSENGEFRLLPHTGARPALQGLARPSRQAEALASAFRTAG